MACRPIGQPIRACTKHTDGSRYEGFLTFATHNAECYNALQAQAYYHIGADGFGSPHWRALYQQGEAMKLLREKMELSRADVFNECYAIFTATMLLSVEYAHTGHTAWLLHKTTLESMVADKGGLDKLSGRPRDEMLRNEFFLQALVNGGVAVCDWSGGAKLRVQDFQPVDAATEMITIKNGGPSNARRCLCWSIATIGPAAVTESPWRLNIPFMGHVIHRLARGEAKTARLRKMLHCYYLYGANPQTQPERYAPGVMLV